MSDMREYLCYDIRGIQSFVFRIPRLKYIIGGSALIDRFDRATVPELARRNGWNCICSGGGKGAFLCESVTQGDAIQNALRSEAHRFGADIRFGQDEDYSEAAHSCDQLFPYLPEAMDGHPCPESGLYPVTKGDVHPVVRCRDWSHGERISRHFETRLLRENTFTFVPGLGSERLVFFHDVEEGTSGCQALGNRNRWAVICMDGNDMGNQFRKMSERRTDEETMVAWVREVGSALDACSTSACLAGIERVLKEWQSEETVRMQLERDKCRPNGETVLPLRPLVVGGDDITMLCHAAYAPTFVREACRVFEETSVELAEAAGERGVDLWPATGGCVTISAGILFCGTSLPLATAIPYTENLLAMAKGKGRALKAVEAVGSAPACVDFEVVTESMLDLPATRRQREMCFRDGDLGDVQIDLTRRPYTVEEFSDLLRAKEQLNLPGSILHQLLPGLRQGYDDRQVFRWRLGKHQKALFDALEEPRDGEMPSTSHWRQGWSPEGICRRHTDLIDIALLSQESRRMHRETAQ